MTVALYCLILAVAFLVAVVPHGMDVARVRAMWVFSFVAVFGGTGLYLLSEGIENENVDSALAYAILLAAVFPILWWGFGGTYFIAFVGWILIHMIGVFMPPTEWEAIEAEESWWAVGWILMWFWGLILLNAVPLCSYLRLKIFGQRTRKSLNE